MTAPESLLDGRVVLHVGDSRDVLAGFAAASIDAVVCDPPYALVSIGKRFGKAGAAPAKDYAGTREGATGAYARASAGFMGQAWDTGETAFDPAFWRAVLRVLKPGGHVVAFGGTRSYHHLATAIETAGFEMRDSIGDMFDLVPEVRRFVESLDDAQRDAFLRIADLIGFEGILAWVYGTRFPKNHDVAKGIDKAAGAKRRVLAEGAPVKRMIPGADQHKAGWEKTNGRVFVPTVTAPATAEAERWQGFGTALKPAFEPIVLARKPLEGTVAETVLRYGTGALNIDGCRVGSSKTVPASLPKNRSEVYGGGIGGPRQADEEPGRDPNVGRHPANLIHDGSDGVVAAFPAEAGAYAPVRTRGSDKFRNTYGAFAGNRDEAGSTFHGDSGSAARFFYSAKADADDRLGSGHPTIKPVDLMRWLVRLVTPPGGVVLDPFAGTGTTGEAAFREGCRAVLVEREERYAADIRRRMALVTEGPATRKAAAAKAKAERRGGAVDAGPLFGATDGEPGEAAE